MKSAFLRALRLRPFLLLAVLTTIAVFVSFTWEHSTSYDDGGVGSAAFLVIAALSIPGKVLGLDFLGSSIAFIALCIVVDLWAFRRLRRS